MSDHDRLFPPSGFQRRTLLRAIALGGGLALTGGLAACSDGSSGGTGASGGTLRVGVPAAIADFDPYNHLTTNFAIMATLYTYLITYDDDFQAHPDAATEWTMADDGQAATITLREATFHDGSAVTAADVVAGIERALDPAVGISQTATASIIEKATAVDPQTVGLTFVKPVSEARFLDFMYWFPVIKADQNSPEALKSAAAGAGPFAIETYQAGDRLELKKFDQYYDSERPLLDSLQVRFFDNKDSLMTALRSNSVDGALDLDGRMNQQLQGDYSITQGAPGALLNLFRLNPLVPPFDNKLVRQAIARAIDRERIIQEVQGGLGEPIYTSLPPNSSAFDPEVMTSQAFDLDAAKALLEKSGGGTSAKVSVASTDKAATSALLIIQEDLAKIGFTLELDTKDLTTVNSEYLAGEAQCVIRPSSNAYQSPMGIIQDSAFRLANNPLWKDKLPEAYLSAIAALDVATDAAQVESAVANLNEALVDESWAIGMFTLVNISAFISSVKGYQRNPADHPVFTNVTKG